MNTIRRVLAYTVWTGALMLPLAPQVSACGPSGTVSLVCGLKSVDIKGTVDSFDSIQGSYGGTNTGNQADVGSDGRITIRSDGFIHGNVTSTLGSVSIMSGATVDGDVTAGTTVTNKGIVNGTVTENAPGVPVVVTPIATCTPLTTSPPLTGPSGSYTYDSKGNLTVNGIVSLAPGTYCFGQVKVQGSGQLVAAAGGCPVMITANGPITVSGVGIGNAETAPERLQILSAYTGTNGVTLSGGSAAYATIYAPETDVILSGGAQLFGAVVGHTLTVTGSGSAIHADISL